MSGQQSVLDPRLGAGPQYPDASQRPPPPYPPPGFSRVARADELKPEPAAYSTHQTPQPYYYPSPQTQTPHQSGVPSGQQTAQTTAQAAYQLQPDNNAGSPEPGDGQSAEDAKRPRACEACRNLKVRCDQDPAHPEIPCKRCAKAGRQCVITQPSRKRQKKADGRVAELEKKLDALTAALQQQQHPGTGQYETPQTRGIAQAEMMAGRSSVGSMSGQYPPPPPPMQPGPSLVRPASPGDSMQPNKRRCTGGDVQWPLLDRADEPTTNPLKERNEHVAQQSEVHASWGDNSDLRRYLSYTTPEEFVNRINSLISQEMAATIFNRYITQLAPHLPAVVFPPGTTAEQVFKEKPILYVCILSAASHGTLHPDISKQITREAVGAIADCVVRNGAKSLELIQAMQVAALWYKPPEKAEQTNFYQVIHMAAVMALDIGLGKRFNPAKAKRGFGGPNAKYAPGPGKVLPQDSDTIEARRAWLGCYFLCASASMVLRRPNLVRWTNYMKECIEVLESHPDAFPSDKLFCQYVKIQHICEDIGLQFLMDDNTANITITDPKVTYALNVLETQLKNWKEKIPPECRDQPGLMFFEHVTSLYLHEIALHFNHNVEDFRMPFTEESLKSVNNTSDTLTTNQMAALEACLKGAHGILDTILAFDIPVVKTLPMLIYFVRCVYAIVILIKMHVAVCTPNSELGKMMSPETLRVEYYIDGLITMFSYVAKDDEFTPHPKILRILNVLRDWFGVHKKNAAAQRRGEQQPSPEKEQYNQTPLHLLSQVATTSNQHQDWTFTTPNPIDYSRRPQNQNYAPAPDPGTMAFADQAGMSMIDPTSENFGWGSGFEQAMDMALLDTEGLQGGGLDNWFLGESMAPFGFGPGGDGAGGGGSGQQGW
ncbi:hypothetical protein LTR37_000008 [Vermiconidia calcicola]|uniref:Uncharacterized protein n=1 Tax=Vermiconidia calcicola TaxID=1690605 RepID=A0ACC3NYK7_9PEZI|nr:hypothetical protein LTR37_000008 [Vermiconidia calcicola]